MAKDSPFTAHQESLSPSPIERNKELPPFPVEVLPEPFQEFVKSAAEAVGTHSDFVGVPFLSAVGGAIGNSMSIRLKRTYVQKPILWTAIVADSGTAKSPALAQAVQPLKRIQAEDDETWLENTTLEGLLGVIGDKTNPSRGLLVLRDELASWVGSFNEYKTAGADRGNWLTLWNGDSTKVTRSTKDGGYAADPAVSVTGGVQPSRLSMFLSDDEDDGFFPRILWSRPAFKVQEWTDEDTDQKCLDAVQDAFALLRKKQGQHLVDISATARKSWKEWYDATAMQTADLDLMPVERAVFSKAHVYAPRLALVLHALSDPAGCHQTQVSTESLEGAIALTRYFVEHGRRVATEVQSFKPVKTTGGGSLRAEVLLAIAEADSGEIMQSALTKKFEGRANSAALQGILSSLWGEGIIGKQERPRAKGRPATVWVILSEADREFETGNGSPLPVTLPEQA